MFQLHPRLAEDSVPVTILSLCEVRLQTDANFPWLVLVPQRESVRHIHRMSQQDQQQLAVETSFVASNFETLTNADNINVAALGNMVPQLHIHIIARFKTDPAWPDPIWGIVLRKAYTDKALGELAAQLKKALIS